MGEITMKRSASYKRRERNNWIMIAIVWAGIIGTCYYGYLGVQCIQHYQALVQGRTTTINLLGGGK